VVGELIHARVCQQSVCLSVLCMVDVLMFTVQPATQGRSVFTYHHHQGMLTGPL
jgi:hypothetical protein